MAKGMAKKPDFHIVRIEATFARRVLAFSIDILILLFIVLTPLFKVFEQMVPQDYTLAREYMMAPEHAPLIASLFLVMGLFAMTYFALLEWQLQSTVGKLFLGLRIESEIGRPSLWQCMVRSFFALPVFPFVLLWVIDPLMMLFWKSRQRLSEILSRTKTIHYAVFFYNNGTMEE